MTIQTAITQTARNCDFKGVRDHLKFLILQLDEIENEQDILGRNFDSRRKALIKLIAENKKLALALESKVWS